MRRFKFIGFVLVLSALAPAQEIERKILRTREQTKDFSALFLNTIATSTTYEAFGLIKTANTGADNEIDATRDTTQAMLDQYRLTYGKPVGYDLLAERTLGSSIIRYESLLKLEKNALRCTITFYKATDTWVPIRVWFDEDVDALFVELGR